jgi:anthranilate synthase component 1
MPADLETPVSAFLKLKDRGAKLLLESVESGTILGRYSFIGIAPTTRIVVDPANVTMFTTEGRITTPFHTKETGEGPLAPIKQLLGSYEISGGNSHPPLLGGMVGYISYDLVRHFERIPDSSHDSLGLPLATFYLVDTLLVFDHVKRSLEFLALADESDEQQVREKVDSLVAATQAPLKIHEKSSVEAGNRELKSNLSRDEFCTAVEAIKEYIAAGEVYQLVLSQRLSGETDADPFSIYRALRMLNPSPYLFYLDLDDTKLIGSSPEALVRLSGRRATVRPIAGTRPRGQTVEEDQKLASELLADEKERAEHVMLVDLGRNDLGRCCKFGSVTVNEFMKVEQYSHVMHITSNVTGTLRDDFDQFDLFRATFPAGTVSGAPKIRAMQLIEKLEGLKRGPYSGAVGYFSLSGDMDWCIAIRTIIMKQRSFFLQAGAGIVADSVPEREYQETMDKLAALKRAIEIAEEGIR